jgi:hypothetical protein
MTVSKLVKLRALEQILRLLLNEAEKKGTSKWKSLVKTFRNCVYAFMVARILIAIYLKVKSKNV